MKFTYTPEALKVHKPYDDAEYDFLVLRAKACILWRMTPEYYDSMPLKEHSAWVDAWNEIQKQGDT